MLCAAAKPHCVTKVSSLFSKSSRFAQIWFVGVVAKGLGVVVFNIEFCHYDNTPMLCSFSCFQNKQTNQKQQRIVTQSRNTKGEEWGWLGESFAHCERLWEELFVYGQLHLSGWDALPRRMKGCHKTKRSQCCGGKKQLNQLHIIALDQTFHEKYYMV